MARIKRASKRGVPVIIENPDPNSNTIYIEGEGYKKDTLAPLFDASMLMYSTGVPDDYFGANYFYSYDTDHRNADRLGMEGLSMALTKPTMYATQHTSTFNESTSSTTSGSREACHRFRHLLSMDPTRPSAPMVRFTDNTDTVSVWHATDTSYNWRRLVYWKNFTGEFHTNNATYHYSQDGDATSTDYYTAYQYLTNNGSYLSGISLPWEWDEVLGTTWGINATGMGITRCNFDGSGQSNGLTMRKWYNTQLIGSSELNGDPIYLYNYYPHDYSQIITKHNTANNTTTDLNNFGSAPATPDSSSTWTNQGGARGTSNIGWVRKWASTTFDDPSSSGNKGFYVPFFDTNYDYHPHFIQWDLSTDNFTRNTDITVNGDLSSNHFSNFSSNYNSTTYNSYTHHAAVWNETFVSNNTRYLTLIPMCDVYQKYDNSASSRTIVTYTVNALDPKDLTHKNAVTVPYTIRNAVFLNDAKTILGIMCNTAFYIYKWNDSTGWDLASTLGERFNAVGRDSLDRIWAASSTYTNYADIHLITTDTPVQITVVPENTSYDYTGSTIATYVNVSAYDYTGARMAIGVTLEIAGSSMEFSGGASTVNVTTSATAETQVALNIVDGGFSEITAYTTV